MKVVTWKPVCFERALVYTNWQVTSFMFKVVEKKEEKMVEISVADSDGYGFFDVVVSKRFKFCT